MQQRKDRQARCPVCSGLLAPIATKREIPNWCPYCNARLPDPNEAGYNRMITQARVQK